VINSLTHLSIDEAKELSPAVAKYMLLETTREKSVQIHVTYNINPFQVTITSPDITERATQQIKNVNWWLFANPLFAWSDVLIKRNCATFNFETNPANAFLCHLKCAQAVYINKCNCSVDYNLMENVKELHLTKCRIGSRSMSEHPSLQKLTVGLDAMCEIDWKRDVASMRNLQEFVCEILDCSTLSHNIEIPQVVRCKFKSWVDMKRLHFPRATKVELCFVLRKKEQQELRDAFPRMETICTRYCAKTKGLLAKTEVNPETPPWCKQHYLHVSHSSHESEARRAYPNAILLLGACGTKKQS